MSGASHQGLLEIVGLTKRFGGLTAVSNASLTIEPGSIHGLIGPNGAGKSTVINLISGFLRADAGTVSFASSDLTRLDPTAIARLGVSRTFVYEILARQEMTAVKIGGKTLIRADEIERYFATLPVAKYQAP